MWKMHGMAPRIIVSLGSIKIMQVRVWRMIKEKKVVNMGRSAGKSFCMGVILCLHIALCKGVDIVSWHEEQMNLSLIVDFP